MFIYIYFQHGNLQRCQELIESGFDINARDDCNATLMHWAAINNRIELMKYFISKGAAIDEPGGDLRATPLHWATR